MFGDLFLGLFPRADIAEAPDPAERFPIDQHGARGSLEDPAVLEVENVETFLERMIVKMAHLREKLIRRSELGHDIFDRKVVVIGRQNIGRDVPHLHERLVVRKDLPVQSDGQDAVEGRIKRGAQQGERPDRLAFWQCFFYRAILAEW